MNIRRWLNNVWVKRAAFASLFFPAFLVGVYWLFPYNRLVQRLSTAASAQGFALTIGNIGPSWLFGVVCDDVVVRDARAEEGAPDLATTLEEVVIRVSPLRALFGTQRVRLVAELGAGRIDALLAKSGSESRVQAEIDAIELRQAPIVQRYTKIPLSGALSGEIDVNMQPEMANTNGNVSIHIDDFTVGGANATIKVPGWGGLTIDKADLGRLSVEIPIKAGEARIDEFKSNGRDLSIAASGTATLAQPLATASLNVLTRIEIHDEFKQRSAKLAALLDLGASNPMVSGAKTPDGALQYRFQGTLISLGRPYPAGTESIAP